MIDKFERLPEWARWVLLLPLSAGFSLAIVLILSIIRDDFAFIHSAASIVSFMIALHALAPRWKNQLVAASLILRMLLCVILIGFIFYMGESPTGQTWFEIGREIFGWVSGWALYFKVYREQSLVA